MPTSTPRKNAAGKKVTRKPVGYTFTWKGKRYEMPLSTDATSLVDNDVWMEAYLDQDDAEKNMRLIYEAYKADTTIPEDVRAALNDMPAEKFIEHIVNWFAKLDSKGVSAGESSGSAAR